MALQQMPAGASNSLASQELACTGVSSVQGTTLDLRNFAKFSGMFLEANITVSLTQQLKPKNASKVLTLPPGTSRPACTRGILRIPMREAFLPIFPPPTTMWRTPSPRDCLTFNVAARTKCVGRDKERIQAPPHLKTACWAPPGPRKPTGEEGNPGRSLPILLAISCKKTGFFTSCKTGN